MTLSRLFAISALAFFLLPAIRALADAPPAVEAKTFGSLQATDEESAKSQALKWLQSTNKTGESLQKAFNAVWKDVDAPLLDKVSQTFALGDAEAAKLLAEAHDLAAPAPLAVPDLLKDASKPAFFRANLGLAYAKALSGRRIYEETLDCLKSVKAEQVVDPASYFFHRAVAEHALELRGEANQSIIRLLDDVTDSPERYKTVAALMVYDMLGWQDKDLGSISRKMDSIERRLDLARGGPQTQDIQRKVVRRLDEMIKELENQASGSDSGNDGNCPNSGKGPNNTIRPTGPMQDSHIGTGSGPGGIDLNKFHDLAKKWGNLPEKDRPKAMLELTQNLPPQYRALIEDYFKKQASEAKPAGER